MDFFIFKGSSILNSHNSIQTRSDNDRCSSCPAWKDLHTFQTWTIAFTLVFGFLCMISIYCACCMVKEMLNLHKRREGHRARVLIGQHNARMSVLSFFILVFQIGVAIWGATKPLKVNTYGCSTFAVPIFTGLFVVIICFVQTIIIIRDLTDNITFERIWIALTVLPPICPTILSYENKFDRFFPSLIEFDYAVFCFILSRTIVVYIPIYFINTVWKRRNVCSFRKPYEALKNKRKLIWIVSVSTTASAIFIFFTALFDLIKLPLGAHIASCGTDIMMSSWGTMTYFAWWWYVESKIDEENLPSLEDELKESIEFILRKRVDLNGDLTRRHISELSRLFFERFADGVNDVSNPQFWASVDIKDIRQLRKQAKVPIRFEILWHEFVQKTTLSSTLSMEDPQRKMSFNKSNDIGPSCSNENNYSKPQSTFPDISQFGSPPSSSPQLARGTSNYVVHHEKGNNSRRPFLQAPHKPTIDSKSVDVNRKQDSESLSRSIHIQPSSAENSPDDSPQDVRERTPEPELPDENNSDEEVMRFLRESLSFES